MGWLGHGRFCSGAGSRGFQMLATAVPVVQGLTAMQTRLARGLLTDRAV